jgi:hypothetical protein
VRGAARKGGPYRDYFLLAHIYALHGILARGLLTFISDYRAAFSVVLIGNQTDSE